MNTMVQWIHQNNIILLAGIIFLGSLGLMTWWQMWTKRKLAVWLGCLAFVAGTLFWLQTPSATITEANLLGAENTQTLNRTNLEFTSIEEIEAYLGADSKPTLVEFYSDFGFS